MKIAVIHFRFNPLVNYAENVYAATLQRLGHEVRVFTTWHGVKEADRHYIDDCDQKLPYQIVRSESHFSIGATVIPLDSRVKGSIRDFSPDVAIMLAPHHGPSVFWLSALPKECKVISGFSDLPWHERNPFLWKYVKKPWIRKVMRRSVLVLSMTDDTDTFLRKEFSDVDLVKMTMCGLFYDSVLYENQECSIPPTVDVEKFYQRFDQVVLMVTHTHRKKNIEQLMPQIGDFLRENPHSAFVFAGVSQDEYGQELIDFMEAHFPEGRFLVLPSQDAVHVKWLCERSYVSLWPLVSIGIQQAMACGCPCLIKQGMPVDHFFIPDLNGKFFRSDSSDLCEVLQSSCVTQWDREKIRGSVKDFSSDVGIAKILHSIGGRRL